MTRTEHLLTILGEECAEIAQRASKASRFGLDEVQIGQPDTNAERIMQEFDDLCAVIEMLQAQSLLPGTLAWRRLAKKQKVEKYLAYSKSIGTLCDA